MEPFQFHILAFKKMPLFWTAALVKDILTCTFLKQDKAITSLEVRDKLPQDMEMP